MKALCLKYIKNSQVDQTAPTYNYITILSDGTDEMPYNYMSTQREVVDIWHYLLMSFSLQVCIHMCNKWMTDTILKAAISSTIQCFHAFG